MSSSMFHLVVPTPTSAVVVPTTPLMRCFRAGCTGPTKSSMQCDMHRVAQLSTLTLKESASRLTALCPGESSTSASHACVMRDTCLTMFLLRLFLRSRRGNGSECCLHPLRQRFCRHLRVSMLHKASSMVFPVGLSHDLIHSPAWPVSFHRGCTFLGCRSASTTSQQRKTVTSASVGKHVRNTAVSACQSPSSTWLNGHGDHSSTSPLWTALRASASWSLGLESLLLS